MLRSLSGRFLILTAVFVLLAEVLIFVPSVARFRQDYLLLRLERAQIASLALLADDMLDDALEAELLQNAGVYNVVLRRDDMRQLALSSDLPAPVAQSYDLRNARPWVLIHDALARLTRPGNEVIRVIGYPVAQGGDLIEVTMDSAPLRAAMLDYGIRIAQLSAVISIITASLLFFAVRALMVRPVSHVVQAMRVYAEAPEDARRIIEPASRITELRAAEDALRALQTDLTAALKQRERLAQLGTGVSKVSHDLRNILTSAQLFTDRLEGSDDPMVKRLAPKLVGSITRAVNLCEATLGFGRVEEPPPRLARVLLAELVADVVAAERLAAGDYDLSFAEDIPAGLSLRADSEQLHRVLLNLVRNARAAIMASGQPGEIALSADETPDHWRIEVSDTGPGLPPRARDHLFEPFQSRASQGGNGLGLTISAELVRGHGGMLDLLNSDDNGTVFRITLPK